MRVPGAVDLLGWRRGRKIATSLAGAGTRCTFILEVLLLVRIGRGLGWRVWIAGCGVGCVVHTRPWLLFLTTLP